MTSNRLFKNPILLFILVFAPAFLTAQQASFPPLPAFHPDTLAPAEIKLIDSSLVKFHQTKNDTGKAAVIEGIILFSTDEKVKIRYTDWLQKFVTGSDQSVAVRERKVLKDILANALDKLGVWYFQQGNMSDAMKYYERSIIESESTGNPDLKATTYNNIGMVHLQQGNIPLSLEFFKKALTLFENAGNKADMVLPLDNIGYVHEKLGDLDLALEYYTKSLRINLLFNDSEMISYSYNNIGHVYEYQGKPHEALSFYQKALALNEATQDYSGMSYSYKNIAAIYSRLDSVQQALEYYNKSLQVREGLEDLSGMAYTYVRIGFLHLREGRISEARKIGEEGLTLARKIGFPDAIAQNANLLSKTAIKAGDYKTALEMRNLEIRMKDSLANEENIRAAAQQQSRYEFEKEQAVKDAAHQHAIEKQTAVAEAEKSRQDIIIAAVSMGLGLTVFFAFFLFGRFRVIRKQKNIIEGQKEEVEHQKELLERRNKEVMDSINYAQRIQEAILPSIQAIKQELKECFVLYQPKDVVAGDFYWMEKQNGRIFFAAADCTGHGVPGAMVSVVCSNALSKALLEENAASTSELLDRTRTIVIDRLAKSGGEVKDGMDISLCSLDLESGNLQWSGANNPLWLVRQGELIEFKPDRQPVGLHIKPVPFSSQSIDLQRGDVIYLFTDGYQDQFGGADEKKFRPRKLKELLMRIADKPVEQQRQLLEEQFSTWKGTHEQVDDVCGIGVRF